MFPYWLLFGLFAVGAILGPRDRAHAGGHGGPLLAFGAIIMALMIGLRYEVGADWDQYEWLFKVAGRVNLERLMLRGDPGYQFINWVIRQLGGEIWQVNLICALVFCWGLLRLARERSAGALPVLVTPERTAAARTALGPDSTLAVQQLVVVDDDPDRGRATGRGPLGFLATMPAYQANFRRMGFTDDDIATLSDRLVDAIVPSGSPDAIAARVEGQRAAGADHVSVSLVSATDPPPLDEWRALAGALLA